MFLFYPTRAISPIRKTILKNVLTNIASRRKFTLFRSTPTLRCCARPTCHGTRGRSSHVHPFGWSSCFRMQYVPSRRGHVRPHRTATRLALGLRQEGRLSLRPTPGGQSTAQPGRGRRPRPRVGPPGLPRLNTKASRLTPLPCGSGGACSNHTPIGVLFNIDINCIICYGFISVHGSSVAQTSCTSGCMLQIRRQTRPYILGDIHYARLQPERRCRRRHHAE